MARENKLKQIAIESEENFASLKSQQIAMLNASHGIVTTKKEKKAKMSTHIDSPTKWLKEGAFYIFGLVYTLVRIAINVFMSIFPFYLIRVTGFVRTEADPTPL